MKRFSLCLVVSISYGVLMADGLQIAVKNANLQEEPNGLSLSTGHAALKDDVRILGEYAVAPIWEDVGVKAPSTDILPRWIKIAAGGTVGYVPEGALASGTVVEMAMNDTGTLTTQARKVTKGFTDAEDDVALSTMKGAAGKGKLGKRSALGELNAALVPGTTDIADIRKFISDGDLVSISFPVKSIPEDRERVTKLAKQGAINPALISKYKRLKDLTKDSQDPEVKVAMDAMQTMIYQSFEQLDPVREHAIGEYVAARFISKYRAVKSSDRRSAYVRRLGRALATAANGPSCYSPCQFILLDAPSVTNACAISGGYIFVMSGLLDFVRDEDELACMLAHELAHIELHHGVRAVGAGAMFQLFSSAADYALADEKKSDSEFAKALDLVFAVMSHVAEDGYGAKLEAEADWRGMQIAARLGYDANAMVDVFKRLEESFGSTGGDGYPKDRIGDAAAYRLGFGFSAPAEAGREIRRGRFETALRK